MVSVKLVGRQKIRQHWHQAQAGLPTVLGVRSGASWDEVRVRLVPGTETTARLLMTGDGGRLFTGDLFHKVVWQGAFRWAGVEYRKRADGMHALRHLYASLLLSQDVSVKELAEYLGHADPGFTLRTYTNLMPSSHERARAAIDEVFAGQKSQGPTRAPEVVTGPTGSQPCQ